MKLTRAAVAFWVCAVAPGCAQPADPSAIQIRNSVSACLDLKPFKIVEQEAVVKLLARGKLLRSTGECGCKSALLTYRVLELRPDGQETERVKAYVSVKMPAGEMERQFTFVISGDARLGHSRAALSLGCTLPE